MNQLVRVVKASSAQKGLLHQLLQDSVVMVVLALSGSFVLRVLLLQSLVFLGCTATENLFPSRVDFAGLATTVLKGHLR